MKFTPNSGANAPASTMASEQPRISSVPPVLNPPVQSQPSTEIIPGPSSLATSVDTVLKDSIVERPSSPAITTGASPIPPPRNGTPSRQLNGDSSRAASLHPEPPTMPKEAPPHGAPARQYLNTKVTGVLLEGMKQLAKEQPKDPLRVLGEYLLQKSRELEGTT